MAKVKKRMGPQTASFTVPFLLEVSRNIQVQHIFSYHPIDLHVLPRNRKSITKVARVLQSFELTYIAYLLIISLFDGRNIF